MKRLKKWKEIPKEFFILGIILVLIAIVGVMDLRKGKPAVTNSPSISNSSSQRNTIEKEEGNISVSVQYLPEKSDGNSTLFNIALDTHSVPLDSFYFQKGVILKKEGNTYSPIKVTTEGEGHHRKAYIVFTSVEIPFTIILLDLGGVARRKYSF